MSQPSLLSQNIPIQVTLKNSGVFEQFSPDILEQRLTSKGTFYFPYPIFQLSQLDPLFEYTLGIRFDRISDEKFKYQKGQFVESSYATRASKSDIHYHQSKIEKVDQCEAKFLIKLTSDPENPGKKKIFLETLCKYQPVLLVQKFVRDPMGVPLLLEDPQEFKFECLKFVTTSNYYSKHVAELKTRLNPFSSIRSKREKTLKTSVKEKGNSKVEQKKTTGSTKMPKAVKNSTKSKARVSIPLAPTIPANGSGNQVMCHTSVLSNHGSNGYSYPQMAQPMYPGIAPPTKSTVSTTRPQALRNSTKSKAHDPTIAANESGNQALCHTSGLLNCGNNGYNYPQMAPPMNPGNARPTMNPMWHQNQNFPPYPYMNFNSTPYPPSHILQNSSQPSHPASNQFPMWNTNPYHNFHSNYQYSNMPFNSIPYPHQYIPQPPSQPSSSASNQLPNQYWPQNQNQNPMQHYGQAKKYPPYYYPQQ